MAARKSNTMKYVLIAGVAAVGYYFYTRSSSQAIASGQPDPLQVAVVQAWAGGLTGSNAVNFQNKFSTLSAADISNLYGLITSVFNVGATASPQQQAVWDSLTQRIGLA